MQFSDCLDNVSSPVANLFLVGLVHCLRNLQVFFFFYKNNFKIGSHDTIHTFKNYFTTVFSVLSNKWYPNRPLY